MTDTVYDRTVGLHMETDVNHGVHLVKVSLGSPKYQVLVSASRDRVDRGAWTQSIDSAVEWRRGGIREAKYNGK